MAITVMHSLDEVALIPDRQSYIEHRDLCDVYDEEGNLPIFVAPMTCILNKDNIDVFKNEKVIPILPVFSNYNNIEILKKYPGWVSLTKNQFEEYFVSGKLSVNKKYKILIDCAQGHLASLYDSVKKSKKIYGKKLKVMIGNIANPRTYINCCESGVDYVRLGIGGGSGCTTSVQTGMHASIPWLLEGIKKIKDFKQHPYPNDGIEITSLDYHCSFDAWIANNNYTKTKIVADGGINNIGKAIKALALGADYVMMGKLFAQCDEACGETKINSDGLKIRHYYGQASEYGQIDRFGYVKSNPEGTDIWIDVNTNIKDFTNTFTKSLKSSMSYANAENLKEFIGNVEYYYQGLSEFQSYNK